MFSATVRAGIDVKCWCTMPMPRRRAATGDGPGPGDAVRPRLARVRAEQAVGDVHQSGLAGAVLAQQPVDLAGRQNEIGSAERLHGAETLGDGSELEGGQGWRSHPRGVVVELPLEAEPCREMGRQRLDADRLGGVVAGVDHVHPELHRVEVGVVRSFAGDERVEPRSAPRRRCASPPPPVMIPTRATRSGPPAIRRASVAQQLV